MKTRTRQTVADLWHLKTVAVAPGRSLGERMPGSPKFFRSGGSREVTSQCKSEYFPAKKLRPFVGVRRGTPERIDRLCRACLYGEVHKHKTKESDRDGNEVVYENSNVLTCDVEFGNFVLGGDGTRRRHRVTRQRHQRGGVPYMDAR